ncbi:MAG TPA: LamG-like jellyroll fold domain-containing protein [Verrucomicrobiae bacterium]|nr:LamG-like jellyroll fold domain-containing protein [Verrucomicrobiae bacterium]
MATMAGRLWQWLLLGALMAGFAPAGRADSDMHTVLAYTSGTRITANAPVVGGTRYGRLIRLQHAGVANGTLLATFECWPNDFRFYKSTDDGFSWTQISAPVLSSLPGWVMKVEPDLYELPAAVGNLPAGTILLAGNGRTNDFNINSHRMEVWYSTNVGVSWQFRGVVDTSTNQGLWEPRLDLTSAGQLVCYYSDERFQAGGYNQLLGGRVSPDGGLTWGSEFYVCAIPDGVKRPGMAVTARLPNGQYVLSYEGVAFGGWSQVYLKFSNDGIHWGSGPTDLGTPVQTASGAYVGACPYLLWSPAGGPNGTLIVSGQFLRNSPNTDRQLFINTNLGQGNWTMLPAPVQWQGGGNNLAGWSQGMIPTADGQGIIQMVSSQITVNGNTNNNEMLVGRAELILPGHTYTLANQKSGLALNIPGNSAAPGVGLQQDDVVGGAAQQWQFNDLGNNVWTIINPGNQLAWDDSGWSTAVGTKLEQWDYNGLPVQQFKLRPVGNGAWKFINVNAGLNVAVTNAAANAGAAIVLWTNTATAEQNWFPSQPNHPPAAHYPLEGDTLDHSGNGNDGLPSATATNYVTGRFGGRALQFNGVNSYVQIPRSAGPGSYLTLMFWLKTTSPGGSGLNWFNGAGLVDGEVAGVVNDFGVTLLNGRVAFGVGNPDTTLVSTVPVNDGQWHHVAVTRNSLDGRMAVYLDGALNTKTNGPPGGRVAPPFLRLGSLQTGVGNFFSGVLDDVRLYNSWLDTNTFAQLLVPPALQARLPFDESSGISAADATGHGWNGTLVNGPAWVAGHDGNAVSLNGSASNYVSLPAGVVSGLTRCSLAAWVKLSASSTWARIFDFGTGNSNYLFLAPMGAGNLMRCAITTTGGTGEQRIDFNGTLPVGGWHHVTVTLGDGIGVLYLDGAPVATNQAMTLTPADLGNTTQNWLGRSQYPADPYLSGVVDDFRIYRGVLSPAEVASFVTPLAAPNGLAAVRGDGQVQLNWDAVATANGYNLRRATLSGGPYTLVATNLPGLDELDAPVTNGTRYYYVVSATNTVTESAGSAEVSVVPTAATPAQLAIVRDGGQLRLNWPGDHTGWRLQTQTNPLAVGLGGAWFTLPDADHTNQFALPFDLSNESVFFRLQSPY